MWVKYRVKLQVRDRIMGGIPKQPEMIEAWLKSRDLLDLEEQTKQEMAGQLTDQSWEGFKGDGDGLYIEDRQVKAMLKEAANIVRHVIKFKGFMRARVAERVFVRPKRIYLGVGEADGFVERAIHVRTARGPRDAIKRSDYVSQPAIGFDLWVLGDGVIRETHLQSLLEYAGEAGLGASRSQGEGQFELEELTRVGKFETIE